MAHAIGKVEMLMQQCVSDCIACHNICLETAKHCMHMGGSHSAPQNLVLLLDCHEICQTSANFMLRGSEFSNRICGVCADACRRCAEICEGFSDDEQMASCESMCRSCMDSCEQMANM